MDPPGGDDKWKLSSSKGRSRSGRPHATTMMDASSSAGGSSSVLSRSYSASVATTRTGSSSSSSWSSCQQQQQGSSKKKSVGVAEAVKEHRARFYIVRRCVSMLVCWRDY